MMLFGALAGAAAESSTYLFEGDRGAQLQEGRAMSSGWPAARGA